MGQSNIQDVLDRIEGHDANILGELANMGLTLTTLNETLTKIFMSCLRIQIIVSGIYQTIVEINAKLPEAKIQ